MNQWSTEFKVGAFAIVAMAIIAYMFMVLGGRFDSVDYNSYYTNLSNAAGIIPKSQVKTNGVLVGEVAEVRLIDNRTQIKIQVDETVRIPDGSTLEVRSKGLLGDVFLEIVRVKDKGEYIEDGGYIPHSSDSVDMQTLMKTFGAIGSDIKKITSTITASMDAGGESSGIQNIIKNVEKTTESLDKIVSGNAKALETLITNLRDSSEIISSALKQNKNGLGDMLANLDRTAANLDEVSSSVKTVAEKIERGEGTIGRLLTDDTVVKNIEDTLTDVRRVIQPIGQTVVEVDFHGELDQNNDENFRNFANIKIHTKPDKYYLLGIADIGAEDRLVRDRTTTTSTTGATTTENLEQSSTRETRLKFNLQFAKRWDHIGVRFGLFQSEGGIASDLYLWKGRMRFSVEAFNFATKDEADRKFAHLKSYASLTFFNHLYAVAGVDDITARDANGDRANPNYFFGAGLSFNDDDIRTLLGFAATAR